MEPVTHILTGAVLARTGINRRTAYATLAMCIAAELPDIDVLWGYLGPNAGPITGFEHHRGITHTFVAVPFEAALLTALFYAVHRLRSRAGKPTSQPQSPSPSQSKAPFRPTWLLLGTFLALLSHLLLDWTNNYGIRPFFPFNPRWYAGSFVFIVEPLLYLILLAALLLPSLFGLINAEVGTRRPAFRGRASALAALLAITAFYLFRFTQHAKALTLAAANPPTRTLPSQQPNQPPGDPSSSSSSTAPLSQTVQTVQTVQPTRLFASPHPLNPFLWHIVADTPTFYQLSTLNTRTGLIDPITPADTLYKPPTTLSLLAAKRSPLGRIYLDWAQYPLLTEARETSDSNHLLTRITFTDARFLYDTPFLHAGPGQPTRSPLSASVLLDMQAPEAERVLEEEMNGRKQEYVYITRLKRADP